MLHLLCKREEATVRLELQHAKVWDILAFMAGAFMVYAAAFVWYLGQMGRLDKKEPRLTRNFTRGEKKKIDRSYWVEDEE